MLPIECGDATGRASPTRPEAGGGRVGQPTAEAGGGRVGKPTWLPVAFLFVAALALRMTPALSPAVGSKDFLVTDDPPYHVLRVVRLLADPPGPDDPDPLVAHPRGAVAPWPWGFDWLLAIMTGPVAGSPPDPQVVALAASFAIPWLGALAIPCLFGFGGPFAHRRAVLIGAGLLCILPAHHDYSFFGRVDHHVIEPLIPLLALAGPLRAQRSGSRADLLWVLASGFAAGASFALFPAALPVAAPSVVVGGGLLLARRPGLAAGYGLAGLASTFGSLAASPHPWEWVFHSPSLLQATAMALPVAGLVTGSTAGRLGARTPCARIAWGASGTAAAGVLALAVLDGFWQGLVQGVQYFQGWELAALSFESQPLWADVGRAGTLATWLAPLAVIGVVRWLWAAPGEPGQDIAPRRAAGVLAVFLLGPAAFQRRFLVAASPFLALAVGEALWWLWTACGRASHGRRLTGRAALIGAALVGLAPSTRHVAALEPLSAMDRAMTRAARTVVEAPGKPHAPPGGGAGPLDRGVLAPWSFGHVFQWEAGLPTVCDNFFGPPENDAALRTCLEILYERDEAKSASRLREMRIAFVVLEPPHPDQVRAEAPLIGLDPDTLVTREGAFRPAFAQTLWGRLGLFARTAQPGDSGPARTTFAGRVREVRRDTGAVQAEVLLFSVDPTATP